MATPAQISANRLNAQHSTGPRTEQGKAVVAGNAVSHGLAGRHVVLPGEDPSEYDRLLAGLAQHHQPQGPSERFLVEQMAQAQWKLERIARMEARLYEQQLTSGSAADPAAVFEHDCAGPQTLLKLNRYENATRRAWFQALNQLRALQSPRRQEDFQRAVRRENEKFIDAVLNAPVPAAFPARTNPIPARAAAPAPSSAPPRSVRSHPAEEVTYLHDLRALRL